MANHNIIDINKNFVPKEEFNDDTVWDITDERPSATEMARVMLGQK